MLHPRHLDKGMRANLDALCRDCSLTPVCARPDHRWGPKRLIDFPSKHVLGHSYPRNWVGEADHRRIIDYMLVASKQWYHWIEPGPTDSGWSASIKRDRGTRLRQLQ